jgi:DNA-directed RNA polymerase subunit RPC12/RpoP
VRTRKLEIACPTCGSREVFYSCTPNCCFNHVCAECGTTFEPVTRRGGGQRQGLLPPDPPPEAADPTAECAVCDSIAVSIAQDGAVVCTKCGAVLVLELTEVSPG